MRMFLLFSILEDSRVIFVFRTSNPQVFSTWLNVFLTAQQTLILLYRFCYHIQILSTMSNISQVLFKGCHLPEVIIVFMDYVTAQTPDRMLGWGCGCIAQIQAGSRAAPVTVKFVSSALQALGDALTLLQKYLDWELTADTQI